MVVYQLSKAILKISAFIYNISHILLASAAVFSKGVVSKEIQHPLFS